MALDGIMLNKVVLDLNKTLPMRINKIYGINKTELLFHVKTNKESKVLLIIATNGLPLLSSASKLEYTSFLVS